MDTPIIKYLPQLQLYDAYATHELTVRDAAFSPKRFRESAGDLLFWPDTNVTREDVVARARFIQPASSFRSRYAYNNLMFVVAVRLSLPSLANPGMIYSANAF